MGEKELPGRRGPKTGIIGISRPARARERPLRTLDVCPASQGQLKRRKAPGMKSNIPILGHVRENRQPYQGKPRARGGSGSVLSLLLKTATEEHLVKGAVLLTGLTPATTYLFQARALMKNNTYTDWSASVPYVVQ